MKCGNCNYGEPYWLVPNDGINKGCIKLIKCPFGDQVFRLPEKRCAQFPKRKEMERRDGYVEEDSETDRCEITSNPCVDGSIHSSVS